MRDRRFFLRVRVGKMKLSPSVFYREYNGKTFVVDTRLHRTYRFDTPIAQLMDLFKADTTRECAKQKLLERYPQADRQIISDDVDRMASFLSANKMLLDSVISEDYREKDVKPNTRFFQIYTIYERILYSALFELTYRCCEKCVHCYLEPDSYYDSYNHSECLELSTQEIKNALDQLEKMNVMCVTFSGGEPFLREDIFDILEYSRKKDFLIDVFSNGILLSEEDINHLARLRISCFHSSLYSHIPEKHDAVTRVHGSFEKTLNTLHSLSVKGIYVNIKFVLMEQNKKDFTSVVKLARSIGATAQLISSISPSKHGNCRLPDLGVRSDKDLKKALQYWNSISDFKPYQITPDSNTPICEAGRNSISINPYGIVTPCNAFPLEIGNLRKHSISEIWNNSESLKKWQNRTIEDLTECQGCKYNKYCCFCPGNALIQTGNMFGKVKEACRQAKMQYDLHTDTHQLE